MNIPSPDIDLSNILRTLVNTQSEAQSVLVDILEAVRALKPAPDYAAIESHRDTLESERSALDFQCKVQLTEVDRMNQVVADQALTIGVLKDENARLHESVELHSKRLTLCAIAARGGLSGYEEELNSEALQEVLKFRAELKRFREREDKVLELVRLADDYAGDTLSAQEHPLWDAIEAVRDFKVTP